MKIIKTIDVYLPNGALMRLVHGKDFTSHREIGQDSVEILRDDGCLMKIKATNFIITYEK